MASGKNVKPGETRTEGRYAELLGLFAGNQYIQRTTLREKRRNTVNPTVIFHAMIPIHVRNMTVHASYRAVVSRHICTDFA